MAHQNMLFGPRYLFYLIATYIQLKRGVQMFVDFFFFLSFLRTNAHMCVHSCVHFGDIYFFLFITRHPKWVLNTHHVCFNFFFFFFFFFFFGFVMTVRNYMQIPTVSNWVISNDELLYRLNLKSLSSESFLRKAVNSQECSTVYKMVTTCLYTGRVKSMR